MELSAPIKYTSRCVTSTEVTERLAVSRKNAMIRRFAQKV